MNYKHTLFFSFIFFAVLVGCKRDFQLFNISHEENRNLTVQEAKLYFEQYFNKNINKLAGLNGKQLELDRELSDGEKQLVWKDAKIKFLEKGGNSIMVPLDFGSLYQKTSSNGVMRLQDLNYMFMYKDSLGGIRSEWVSLYPDSSWAKGKRDVYHGIVEVKNWEGAIIKQYFFNKYGAFQEITSKNKSRISKEASNKFSSVAYSSKSCIDIITYKWDCNCQTTTPDKWKEGWVVESVKTFCFTEDFGGSSGLPSSGNFPGNPGPPDLGGGGNEWSPNPGDYTPPACNPNEPGCTAGNGEIWQNPNEMTPITPYDILIHNFPALYTQINYINSYNQPIINNLSVYLLEEEFSTESLGIVKWFIEENYKGNITWEQFENWFMGEPLAPEYLADAKTINDVNYWKTVNFPQQNLPSFDTFESNFPTREKNPILELAEELGGDIGDFIISEDERLRNLPNPQVFNSCALRLSIALLKSGLTIPNIPDPNGGDRSITMKDKNGNYYFIRADEMDMWMQLTFGTADGKARFMNLDLSTVLERKTVFNSSHRRYEKVGNYKKLPNSERTKMRDDFIRRSSNPPTSLKRGIYSMISEDRDFGTGHVDLIDDTSIADGGWYLGNHTKILNIWNF